MKNLVNKELSAEEQHAESLQVVAASSENKNQNQSHNNKPGKINANLILTEMVNKLTLPGSAKKQQVEIATLLSHADNDEDWKSIAHKLTGLVNKSISDIEQEKRELASYAAKIDVQLENIESFIHEIRRYSDENKAPPQATSDIVEATDSAKQVALTKSTALNTTEKQSGDIAEEMMQSLDELKHDDAVQDDMPVQSYAEIMEELSRSQMESKKLKEQLHTSKIQLLRDPLTSIPNTLAFDERVDVEFHRWKRHKTPLCLAIWDMDNITTINENYGHDVGDQVLKVFADIIHTRIRKVDLFARIAGEEFALLLPDTPMDMALMLNEKLRVMVEQCDFKHEGKPVAITSSVGLAEFQPGDEIINVLQRADQALYWSKHDGKNKCTVFKNKTRS